MFETKALQLSYLHQKPDELKLLVRGVFWPFWPLRGSVVFRPDAIELKVPGRPAETLPRERVREWVLDKLGAGVFVFLTLNPLPEPAPPETVPAETAASEEPEAPTVPAAAATPAPKPPPTKPPVKGAKETPPPEPALEKRYLGFFASQEEALTLALFGERHQYGVSAFLGNWRKEHQVPC